MTTEGRSHQAPKSRAKRYRYRLFIVEQYPLVREGLRAFLERQEEFVVIGEASTAQSILESMALELPDLVLLEISGDYYKAALVTAQIKREWPTVKVVAMADNDNKNALRNMVEASASGYVLKSSSPDELLKALRCAANGSSYIDPGLADVLLEVLNEPLELCDPLRGVPTERELFVLKLTARGYYSKEIGEKLGIGAKTIDTHKARGMLKLGLESRVELVRYALAQGWLEEA